MPLARKIEGERRIMNYGFGFTVFLPFLYNWCLITYRVSKKSYLLCKFIVNYFVFKMKLSILLLLAGCAFNVAVNEIDFPLKTGASQNGQMFIYDSSGQRVKLACVNWSGFQLTGYVANGLDKQPLTFIAQKIAAMGFNCVRLVNSLDIIFKNPVRKQ